LLLGEERCSDELRGDVARRYSGALRTKKRVLARP
jgi:hypothetical protein